MDRLLFARGAQGPLIADLQVALHRNGFDPKGADGVFGRDTETAVRQFQAARFPPVTGTVSGDLWVAATSTPVPTVESRSLQLTSSFEGHSYTLAQGNWDGAWITWGIIGFTLKHGQIQEIVRRVRATAPQRIDEAFGPDAAQLLSIIDASGAEQEAFANRISIGARLADPWRTHFSTFGTFREVQVEQCARAHAAYYEPALRTAAELGLTSELGLALCFDVHVQNGGISAAARQRIRAGQAGRPEAAVREAVADEVANRAKARFRDDVRSRKLAIARGQGVVHGRQVVLADWGLTSAPATDS
jgi:peptidoglycan hydrolase-like protein with peptidoglycan-binding domain